jgi:geranylgeranyl pyrophosphate synthase
VKTTTIPNLSTDAREFLASCRPLIDAELDRMIPKESVAPERVHSAMRWSLFAVSKAELELIHHHKTGALIRAAARSGAMIAGAGAGEPELLLSISDLISQRQA